MKFQELLQLTAEIPLFETGFLLSGDRDPRDIQRQLSRWASSGKIIKLRKGLYALASPYRKVTPHPFLVANYLVLGSYVSLQSALAYYGLIPEYVPVTLSMTTRSPATWENPFGFFQFHHILEGMFSGYQTVDIVTGQAIFIASPEKALLDLVHLTPGGDDPVYLDGLRLQNLESLDPERLFELAGERPKLRRAAETIARFAALEMASYETL